MLPDFPNSTAFWNDSRLRRSVLLVRATCRSRSVGSIGGMTKTRETPSTLRKTVPYVNLSTTNLTWIDLGSNKDLRCARPMVVCVKNIQKLSSHLTVNMLLVSCNDFRSVLLESPFLQDLPLRHPVADSLPTDTAAIRRRTKSSHCLYEAQ
jgi:hypothetical protein